MNSPNRSELTTEVDNTIHAASSDRPANNQFRVKIQQWTTYRAKIYGKFQQKHKSIPYIRALQLPAILIIALLVVINLVVWAICGLVLASHYTHLLSTAALAYSLGLRHALDADHISAIDLMTRRLIATGQRPVTVGTFFSLGHSTIVIVTSVVVAATAAGISDKFDRFSNVGGIIGTSVSAAFLIVLGLLNLYILYKLVVQLRRVIRMQPEEEANEAWNVQGGGVLFRILKRMFKLIDRPWKMYPLGILFGLGFDTSSEVALLGISSIQGAKGTSIWLILVFPILFTAGMALIDTIDGALMSSLYLAPMGMGDIKKPEESDGTSTQEIALNPESGTEGQQTLMTAKIRSPLTFLYYSVVLTALTVVVAIIIGMIQLLSLIRNTAAIHSDSRFWQGVDTAGDYYDVIGGAICGSFVIVGIASVLCYRPWRRWVDHERARLRVEHDAHGRVELLTGNAGSKLASDTTAFDNELQNASHRGQTQKQADHTLHDLEDDRRIPDVGRSHRR